MQVSKYLLGILIWIISKCFKTISSGGALSERPSYYKSTNHWKSSYNNSNNLALSIHIKRAEPPDWAKTKGPYSSLRGSWDTGNESEFGHYREKPRDLLPSSATKMLKMTDEKYFGTPKVTCHLPGYGGFIPQSDVYHEAAKQGLGEKTRTTFLKDNITQN